MSWLRNVNEGIGCPRVVLFVEERVTDPASNPVCQIRLEADDPTALLYRLKITYVIYAAWSFEAQYIAVYLQVYRVKLVNQLVTLKK